MKGYDVFDKDVLSGPRQNGREKRVGDKTEFNVTLWGDAVNRDAWQEEAKSWPLRFHPCTSTFTGKKNNYSLFLHSNDSTAQSSPGTS
jgi:hypothetical protein